MMPVFSQSTVVRFLNPYLPRVRPVSFGEKTFLFAMGPGGVGLSSRQLPTGTVETGFAALPGSQGLTSPARGQIQSLLSMSPASPTLLWVYRTMATWLMSFLV